MLCKSPAVVLRSIPYRDTSLILHVFTREYGRRHLLAKGVRSPKAARKFAPLQPLQVLDILFFEKPGRDLQNLTEAHLRLSCHRLPFEPERMVHGLLGLELLNLVAHEETAQTDLYDRTEAFLQELDREPTGHFRRTLAYLYTLLQAAGVPPDSEVGSQQRERIRLDDEHGVFLPVGYPVPDTEIWLYQAWRGAGLPQGLRGTDRHQLLLRALRYFSYHIPGYQPPRSLAVFEQVFAPS